MLPDAGSKYSRPVLNRIAGLTGCGLILDVYNMECDVYNFDFKIAPFLAELNLDAVYEVHLAAGTIDAEYDFKMDVHSRVLNSSTLFWTAEIIDRSPKNLQAITYEILGEFVANVGEENIVNELAGLRKMGHRYAT